MEYLYLRREWKQELGRKWAMYKEEIDGNSVSNLARPPPAFTSDSQRDDLAGVIAGLR